mgnify:CR=1 FL=1
MTRLKKMFVVYQGLNARGGKRDIKVGWLFDVIKLVIYDTTLFVVS